MKEHPIIFSTPMVQAILEGRKTVTRRVITYREGRVTKALSTALMFMHASNDDGGRRLFDFGPRLGLITKSIVCPYGRAGDTLWVRHQHWEDVPLAMNSANLHMWDEFTRCVRWPTGEVILDCEPDLLDRWTKQFPTGWRKKPSIHMPRWAARLFLTVKSVRAERLQEITEEDVIAEGVKCRCDVGQSEYDCCDLSAIDHFSSLWDTINAKRGYPWESNPWVWRIEFERTA